jgi:hypothetical protein
MASRPLHFFWILDCSGSMAFDGKMEALNLAFGPDREEHRISLGVRELGGHGSDLPVDREKRKRRR